MREIKFRGRERESNKWVFGYARHWKCCYGDEWHIQGKNDNVHIVIPESIGQFTGLLDSEGREIFEGDILRFAPPLRWEEDERRVGVVVYKYFAFVVKYGDLFAGLFNLAANDTPYTIIGNIYDNPELLEAKDA